MKYQKLIAILVITLLISCGGDKSKKDTPTNTTQQNEVKKEEVKKEEPKTETASAEVKASKKVDLKNNGVGTITSVKLDSEINQEMVVKGADVFKRMCTACHKPNKKFIGPSPQNILERRTPEWVMNMILDPEKMIKEDPLARELLIEFNGSPMANQNLTEEDARAVLEYFRTLK
jgi:mono/diheme cytochrome c family protein